jgi:two-component system cell cycle sensor histidine kinase/response regulator CckA
VIKNSKEDTSCSLALLGGPLSLATPAEPLAAELYQGLFERSADGVLLARLDGSVLRANPAACRALRMTEAEVLRLGREGVVVDDPALRTLLAERQVKGATAGELRFRRGDGTVFPVEITSALIPGPGGETYACSIFRDITDRKRTEEALRESEERFRIAFQTSPDSLSLNRLGDGAYLATNEGFTHLTGWAASEVMGRTPLETQVWDDPTDQRRLIEALRGDDCALNLEAKFRKRSGEVWPGLLSARVITLRGEKVVLSMTRDITSLKRAEADRDRLRGTLHQTSKMEAIGQLAGGVAHDFNNLLTVIMSCAESLKEDTSVGRPADAEVVDEIAFAADRARNLTRQLLAYARKQVLSLESLDLNASVRASEKLLRRLLGDHVTLQLALQPDLWRAQCDPRQLEQVIVNLSVNARDAMPSGGILTLETSNVEASGAKEDPGAWVRLTVRDTGVGLSPEAREHLFEPFFTTKGLDKGTGLGLATVHGIVYQSGGEIRVESEPGRGTAFQILLPRSTVEATPVVCPAPGAATTGGNETVLVVEDEPAVREVTQRALRAGGYEVLAAASGDEALAIDPAILERVRLLVADVVMPGLDGRATAEELRRRIPSLRVLYVSGYTQDVITQRGALDDGIQFLPKPFTTSTLLARVRALLDAPGRGHRDASSPDDAFGDGLWLPDLATGVQQIDAQHRELLGRIAALEHAARTGQLARAEEVLRYLERYASDHFATEERHMTSTAYPGMAEHLALHLAFKVELARREADFLASRSQAALLVALAEWMAAWLTEHVRRVDAEMARHIRSFPEKGAAPEK